MNDLNSLSKVLVELVGRTSQSLVALKVGGHRTATGIVVEEGHIAAPEHALGRRETVPFVNGTGNPGTAKILGRDPGIDLAILKADGLAVAPWQAADASAMKAGMLAAVVGLTQDVGPSAGLGMVGAVGPERRTWRGGVLDQFVRLDVNLYPSQTGAAVVNAAGELIGMATPALSRHSTMVVPLSTIQRVAGELKKEGRIRAGYLGVGVQPVVIPESLRSKIDGNPGAGLILLSVVEGGPAEQAGLQVGDILLSLADQALEDVEQLQAQLRGGRIGEAVEVKFLRGGEPRALSVVIQEAQRKQN